MAIRRVHISERIDHNSGQSGIGAKMDGKTIVGIDPGTNLMGYAVVKIDGDKPCVVVMGVITLGKYGDPYKKLSQIFERLTALIIQYKPDEMALEAPFFGANIQSMLKLGRAQGVAMAAALSRGLDVFEYAPTRVKQAITGQGRASKEQVAMVLEKILGVETPEKLDATDALSVALCHYYTQCSPVTTREKSCRSSSWQTYINQNPNKIKK